MTLLQTPRLALIPATPATFRAEIGDHAALGRALNAAIPATWPPESVRDVLEFFAQQTESGPMANGWGVYYWISTAEATAPRLLVGSGGFMGQPSPEGAVDIGYGTLPEFQRRGYATEAVRGLVAYALAQPGVTGVFADALPENVASVRVLTHNGFLPIGSGSDPGTTRFTITPEAKPT